MQPELVSGDNHDRALGWDAGLPLLEHISRTLAESLDLHKTLKRVVELIAADFADWCAVDLLEPDGELTLAAVAHRDESKAALAAQLRRYPLDPEAGFGPPAVARSGKAEFVPNFTEAELRARAVDKSHLETLRQLELRSWMVVPLAARGRTLGTLTLVSTRHSGAYTRADLTIACEIGIGAGLAVDNARLHTQAQQAIRLREDMLAIVSHDLRSPLATVSTSAAYLQRKLESLGVELGQSAQLLENIQAAGRQMQRLLGDLQDMGSIQAGRLAIDPQVQALLPVLEESLALNAHLAAEKRLELLADLQLGEVQARVDRERLLQVLGNLIGNAAKFTPAGGTVCLIAGVHGGKARIAVRDSGPGIAPEDRAHLFEPYWSGRAHRRLGAGLGLFISKGIIEAHGGAIDVESEPGEGSVFFFDLPIADSEHADGMRADKC
jgi:signal transduction histidine kinase